MSFLDHPRLLRWRARLIPESRGVGWLPFASLGYMCFLWLPALIPKVVPANWVGATSLAVALFLPLYFRAHWARPRELMLILLAMWSLGVWLEPFNPFSNNMVIFACALAPWVGSPRRSTAVAFGLILSYCAAQLLIDSRSLFSAAITVIVGTAVYVSNYFYCESKNKQRELSLSHDEVRRLAALAERERIGRDLHDLLGHTLSLIAIKTELATRLWERDSHAARQEVLEVERVAREALAQVRRAVSGIRAAGLAPELASARSMLESSGIRFQYDMGEAQFPPEVETCVALAVREAVTNIQRHSQASQACVRLERQGDTVVVHVTDDGRGGDIVPGNGLTGMRERLHTIGATLTVDSYNGRGTHVQMRVPALPLEREPARIENQARAL
ncbi:sensor histidine kinase [Tahibacter amnicola]|uniref:Sensor histidine kinase n=1 Tax=Tahibacter amnicola TaxID=2976241 RepID=A0ABY6BI79_9GAMM|nr:sensor histidine kinase [Tahibacter amnicola]UXI69540.1 sensor histidine kinase [Tahibacter amnicola]